MTNEAWNHCAVLSTPTEFEAAVVDSFKQPLVLLKHSEWCHRSQRIIEAALGELEKLATYCRVVIVQDHRALSDTIARRFNIRHETPQVVVIRNGRVTWHAAHSDINAPALRRAIALGVPPDMC